MTVPKDEEANRSLLGSYKLMEPSSRPSKAKQILLAISYAVNGDIISFQRLASSRANKLPLDIALRILLTYLPETHHPSLYISLLRSLAQAPLRLGRKLNVDLSTIDDLSEGEARRGVRHLRLLPLRDPATTLPSTADALSHFLVHRARRIEEQTGLLVFVLALVAPFLNESKELRIWAFATLIPLLRQNLDALSPEELEHAVQDIALSFYDNASHGNRTRGEMRYASDTIKTFYPQHLPESVALARTEKLLAATHALSFYALTLQPGIPLRPASIRTHPDPITLLGRVLDQNPRSYRKIDHLLDIGRDLAEATQIGPDPRHHTGQSAADGDHHALRMVDRRIIGMAIEAALAEDDFESAYDAVMHRLPVEPLSGGLAADGITAAQVPPRSRMDDEDDFSWRAAFLTGRYRPPHSLPRSSSRSSPASSSDRHGLERRMELLSHALLLAPPAALAGILAAWRQCEEELQRVLAQDGGHDDDRWNWSEHRPTVPSPIRSPAVGKLREASGWDDDPESPMGLFDVARGAAAALSRSAFPLRHASGRSRDGSLDARDRLATSTHLPDSAAGPEDGRVRKRDMVSSMVTGGLASGIGWVLGEWRPKSGDGGDDGD